MRVPRIRNMSTDASMTAETSMIEIFGFQSITKLGLKYWWYFVKYNVTDLQQQYLQGNSIAVRENEGTGLERTQSKVCNFLE